MFHTPKNCLPSISMVKVSPSGCVYAGESHRKARSTPALQSSQDDAGLLQASIKSRDLTIKSCHFIHDTVPGTWWNMELEGLKWELIALRITCWKIMGAFRAEWGNICWNWVDKSVHIWNSVLPHSTMPSVRTALGAVLLQGPVHQSSGANLLQLQSLKQLHPAYHQHPPIVALYMKNQPWNNHWQRSEVSISWLICQVQKASKAITGYSNAFPNANPTNPQFTSPRKLCFPMCS